MREFPIILNIAVGEVREFPVKLRLVPGERMTFPVKIDYEAPPVDYTLTAVTTGGSTVILTLYARGRFAGNITGVSTASASLKGKGLFTANSTGSSVVAASIGVASPGALTGTSAGTSAVISVIYAKGLMAVNTTGTSIVSSSIIAKGLITGTSLGASTVTSTLSGNVILTGTSLGISTVLAGIIGRGLFTGTSTGLSAVASNLIGHGLMTAPSTGSSTVASAITSGGGGGGPTVYLQDSFTDTDAVELTAHTMDVGPGWSLADGFGNGTPKIWSIDTNRAKSEAGLYTIAKSDAGFADVVASVDLIIPDTSHYLVGLLFRFDTNAGYWVAGIERDGGTPYIVILEVTNFGAAYRATTNITHVAGAVNIQVTLSGNSITVLLSSGQSASYSSSVYATATKFGLWNYSDGTYTACFFDNFLVTS